MDEEPLQAAILAAINSAMSRKETLVSQIGDAMRMDLAPIPGEAMCVSNIDRRIGELDKEFRGLFDLSRQDGGYLKYAGDFKRITEEIGKLKERRADLLERQDVDSALNRRIQGAVNILSAGSGEITEWNESVIRQLVDTVKVLSADRVLVRFRGGIEIEHTIEEVRVKWCS